MCDLLLCEDAVWCMYAGFGLVFNERAAEQDSEGASLPSEPSGIQCQCEGIIRHRWVAENPGVEPDYDEIVSIAQSLE